MEFDITFVPRKAIEGQVLAEFLVVHPLPDDFPLITNLLDKYIFTANVKVLWELYFEEPHEQNNTDCTTWQKA